MKKILLIAISILLSTTSCTKDEFSPFEWGITPELELTPLAVILTPSHPCDTVKVSTNYLDFRITKPFWVTVEKMQDFPAIIVAAKSMSGKEEMREGYVTVTVKRGKQSLSRDFVVMQFNHDILNLQ